MIIPIDAKRRIRGVKDCWQLERKLSKPVKKSGKKPVEWQAYAYYPTLGGAARGAARDELRLCEAETPAEAKKAVASVRKRFAAVFKLDEEMKLLDQQLWEMDK